MDSSVVGCGGGSASPPSAPPPPAAPPPPPPPHQQSPRPMPSSLIPLLPPSSSMGENCRRITCSDRLLSAISRQSGISTVTMTNTPQSNEEVIRVASSLLTSAPIRSLPSPVTVAPVEAGLAGDVGIPSPIAEELSRSQTPEEKSGPRPMTAPAGPVSETEPEAAPRAAQASLDLPCSSRQADFGAEAQRALSAGVAEERARNREDAFAEYLRAHAKEGLRHRFSGSQRIAASKFTIVRSKVSCTSSSTLDEESDYRDADAEASADDDDDEEDDITQAIDTDASFNYIFPADDVSAAVDFDWTDTTNENTAAAVGTRRPGGVSVAVASTQVDAAVNVASTPRPLSAAASAPAIAVPDAITFPSASPATATTTANTFSGGLVLLYYRPHGSYASAVDVRYPQGPIPLGRQRTSQSAPPTPCSSLPSTPTSSPLLATAAFQLRASPPMADLAPMTSTSQTMPPDSALPTLVDSPAEVGTGLGAGVEADTMAEAVAEAQAVAVAVAEAVAEAEVTTLTWKSARVVSPPIPVPNVVTPVLQSVAHSCAATQAAASRMSWSVMTLAPAALHLVQPSGQMVFSTSKRSAALEGTLQPPATMSVSRHTPKSLVVSPTEQRSNWGFDAGSEVTLVPNPLVRTEEESISASLAAYKEAKRATSAVVEAEAAMDAIVDSVLASDKEMQEVATSTNSVPPCSRPEVVLAETEPEEELDALEELPEVEPAVATEEELKATEGFAELRLMPCMQDASVQTSPTPSAAALRLRRFLRSVRRFTRAMLCLPRVPQSAATE